MSDATYTPNMVNIVTVVRGVVKRVAAEVLADTVRTCPQDTGNLARSYRMVDVSHGREAAYRVGTNVHYAPFVEFGTYRMAAQPHLGPALAKARRRYG
jgi:HK97 gp10 family phage protein